MSRYQESEEWLIQSEITIPLGSQTFSKSRTQYPVGISPLYAAKAKGPFIWDIDNNKYIDLVNGLGAVTLGYGNTCVKRAIKKQLKKGITLSLPGKLEAIVAEKIVEIIPSAEQVRFFKNGSDATSAAIRLARAYTGKDHILVCGYHGWQDWSISTTSRNKGIPKEVQSLSHRFTYNDIDSLLDLTKLYEKNIAAIILEPINSETPKDFFLENVQKISQKIGAVLIFDETVTGFRISLGGAQEYFNVTPDLSTFGKGIANGMPLSAVVGKKEIMLEFENVFLSGTFGGELLSLAAANAVIDMYKQIGVSSTLHDYGAKLSTQISLLTEQIGLEKIFSLSGHPSWMFLNWKSTTEYSVDQLKTYFMQEMFNEGVLILGTHNVSLAHDEKIMNKTINAYEKVFLNMKNNIDRNELREKTSVEPNVPLFTIR